MKNILKAMQEIYNTNLWRYYGDKNKPEGLDDFTKLLESENAKKFIKEYLILGQKGVSSIFSNKNYIEILTEKKAHHSVFIFFLGLYLYEKCDKIKNAINDKVNTFKNEFNDGTDIHFSYLWFLICFFHDVADKYEEENGSLLEIVKNRDNNKLNFKFKRLDLCEPLFLNNPAPGFYSTIWENYLNYRLSEGKIDHGIFGGLIFYNDRKKQYEEQKKKHNGGSEPFIEDGVWWSKKIVEEVHGYVAWTIIAHNMWYIFDKDEGFDSKKEIYIKYGLDKLISPVEPEIKLDKHPLLFLLCIVDTIDPVKFFLKCKDKDNPVTIKDILEKISISVDENNIKIDLGELSGLKSNKLEKNTEELKKWIDLKDLTIIIVNKGQ